jgi:fatty-acyl-CoA synthase
MPDPTASPARVALAELAARRAALEARYAPWQPRTLPALLDQVALAHPERPFVIGEERTLTYAELASWSKRIACGLIEAGIEVAEHVAVILPNGPALIALRFAIARIGAVAVPVNFLLRARELAYVLQQSRAAALLTMERFRDLDALAALDRLAPGWERRHGARAGGGAEASASCALPALRLVATVPDAGAAGSQAPSGRRGALTLAALEREPTPGLERELERRRARARPADLATIFYTSGTTGRPKGVLSTHEMELRSAYGSALTRAFEDGRRILFALPLHHVFAYIEGLLASLFVAGSVVVQSSFDPHRTLAAIAREGANEALFVPTMSLAVIDAAREGDYDTSSLHSVMSAAATAPARLWRELRELLGVKQLVTGYGMTETSAATTFTFPEDPDELLVSTVGRPKLGGAAGDSELGGLLAVYKTVDPITGVDLPAGAEGELAARGPIVTAGYYEKPEETAAAMLAGGWLRSGDLGRIDERGYLTLTGRATDLYKCGGELVMPAEVEACLTARPDVAQAYVVGVPDERMGEVGCAWVVPAEGAEPDPQELISHCRAELARFKVPAHVLLCEAEELPLTASGKVQRFVLGERAVERLGLAAAGR